ncbi:hypothetical protein [Pseudoalteromonas sp. H105]|uniref:hypothetical protein n=1 Tax=Pseudoalteromonas sp. H105 TaxID=1348393 RepID=UPI000732256A|nr:hypothetical protein [Pseudoalteromonas sp. H105]KTF10027.1 hypothetical protein ATS75_19385 [Pseudoalteromonas sp. H105]
MNFKWIFIATAFFVSQVNAIDVIALYKEDQTVRTHLRSLPKDEVRKYITEVMLPGDKARLSQVESLLNSTDSLSSEEYFAAAMIMQHGSEPKHYKMAMELSKKSASLDPNNKSANWLSCAAEDRYLLKIGKSQVWGTQLNRKMNADGTHEIYYLENFNKNARPDEQRKLCGIPTLAEIESRLEAMAKLTDRNKQYSLWKTGT